MWKFFISFAAVLLSVPPAASTDSLTYEKGRKELSYVRAVCNVAYYGETPAGARKEDRIAYCGAAKRALASVGVMPWCKNINKKRQDNGLTPLSELEQNINCAKGAGE